MVQCYAHEVRQSDWAADRVAHFRVRCYLFPCIFSGKNIFSALGVGPSVRKYQQTHHFHGLAPQRGLKLRGVAQCFSTSVLAVWVFVQSHVSETALALVQGYLMLTVRHARDATHAHAVEYFLVVAIHARLAASVKLAIVSAKVHTRHHSDGFEISIMWSSRAVKRAEVCLVTLLVHCHCDVLHDARVSAAYMPVLALQQSIGEAALCSNLLHLLG